VLQIPLAKLSGDSSDWRVPIDDSLILLESRKGDALSRDPPEFRGGNDSNNGSSVGRLVQVGVNTRL
jgi:hypothetical protein